MAEYAKHWYDRMETPKVDARRQQLEKRRERILNAKRKKCSKCRKLLLRSAFNRHGGQLDGLQGYCRRCSAKHQRAYYQANPDKHGIRKRKCRDWQRNLSPQKKEAARLRALLGRHRLTKDELAALYEACGNRCSVCSLHASEHTWKGLRNRLCIDHIVVAGERVVRGLLCNRCNWLLGRMGDDRTGVMRYVLYLERYEARMKEKADVDWESLHPMQTV